ncbi:50S ribosomal protein L15 [Patescibacteria group bacterium]|nr:50S ribosomal protein L15 [Patescibacteria group bacterium]MCL5010553.1 50S ribosomal protein L15 [Patescibacteria group bacterium]
MNLENLTKTTQRRKKRLGQGHGSGRVKTAGRGTKGQNARGGVAQSFEGGAVSIIKRLPFLRGKGRNKSFRKRPVAVNIASLNLFKKNDIVDVESLARHHIVDSVKAKQYGVKILGDGKLPFSLTVKLPVSGNARKKIEEAGGRVV